MTTESYSREEADLLHELAADYRLGQSYEEGWTAAPDLDKAMEYYHRAAAVYHHLALKRLGKG